MHWSQYARKEYKTVRRQYCLHPAHEYELNQTINRTPSNKECTTSRSSTSPEYVGYCSGGTHILSVPDGIFQFILKPLWIRVIGPFTLKFNGFRNFINTDTVETEDALTL